MAKKPAAGAPAWMATFADLMSLLLVLFVLLLTFAEMDVVKYKQIAGSVKTAFGFAKDDQLSGVIELDGSIIGKSLKAPTPDSPRVVSEIPKAETPKVESQQTDTKEQKAEALEETLSTVLENMGIEDQVGLERVDGEVIISFPNELAFPSGSSGMTEEFAAVLNRVTPVINQTEGEVQVAGHTDNIPVSSSSPYISNWDLSAARATSVLHFMIDQNGIDPTRMVIQGFGDSRPITSNDTAEGRAQNRRVEITIEMVESNSPDGTGSTGTGTGDDGAAIGDEAEATSDDAPNDASDAKGADEAEVNSQNDSTAPDRRRTFSIPSAQ